MRPAAHPQTELTTIMVVPAWVVTARSTSSAVRSSCTPALVSSSRMGMSMSSGYIAAPLGFDDCNAGLDDEECGLDAGEPRCVPPSDLAVAARAASHVLARVVWTNFNADSGKCGAGGADDDGGWWARTLFCGGNGHGRGARSCPVCGCAQV